MPNYSLQINSRFRPFSLQERLVPWQLYGQAYKEAADAYTAMGAQAGDVASMLNKELDREAYAQYQGYMQGLKENADALAAQGLNPTLRNNIYNMTNRYTQEIRPIQRAAERRQLLADEQRKLGNSVIFDFDAATTGLDRFMNNPTLNYQYIDRKDLRNRAEAAFSKFQNELRRFEADGNIDAYHKKLVQEYGYRPEEATAFINGVLDNDTGVLDSSLMAVYNNLYKGTNVDSWNNPEASEAVKNTILEGVGAAIGKTGASVFNNEATLADLKYRNEIRAHKQKLQDKYDFDQNHKDPAYVPPIFRYGAASLNITKEQAKVKKDLDTYNAAIKYFEQHPDKFEELSKKWADDTVPEGATMSPRQGIYAVYRGSTSIGKRPEDVEHFMNIINLSKSLGKSWNGSDLNDDNALPAFNFSVDTDELGRKTFKHNSEALNNMMQDLGTMFKPMYYNISEEGMKNIMYGVHTNVMASTDANDDSKVTLMKNVDGSSVKKKELSGLNWDKSELFMVGDQEYVIFKDKADKGKVFRLEPGATGDFGENAYHKIMTDYYSNRQFEDYFNTATDYMADVFGLYNSTHKGQTGTTKEIVDIPSTSSYTKNSDVYDYDYIYN